MYFNYISVRSFILSGAPFPNKTANTRHWPAASDRSFQHVFPPDQPDLIVVDLDAVQKSTDVGFAERDLAGCEPLSHMLTDRHNVSRASRMATAPPRTFLSYSRADRDFPVALRDELIAAGHLVWHDLKDMGARQWWDQITDQLRAGSGVEHIVLVVSPEALASRIVEREWRLAKREDKTLSAVAPPTHKGRIDFTALPRWMSAEHHYNFTEQDQRARLIADLIAKGPCCSVGQETLVAEDLFVSQTAIEGARACFGIKPDRVVVGTACTPGAMPGLY